MTDKQIIDCEYFKTGEIKFCTALNISFYSDFLCNKGDCIILKLKEQLKAKEQECERLKRQHQGDKGLITTGGKLNYQLLQEYDKLKTALTEIKEVAQYDAYTPHTDLCIKLNWVKKKISEVEE